MSIMVKVGDKIPLNVVLDDGATDKYVRASLYDEANNPIAGSPVPLTHVAEGLYRDDSIVALAAFKRVFSVYEVYDDAGYNWPAYEYDLRAQDVFDLQSSSTAKSTYQVCIPCKLELPPTGTKTYRFVVYVFDDAGVPADPDLNQVYVHIENINNGEILPATACVREQAGVYFYRYAVTSSDAEQPLWVEFMFGRDGNQFLVGQVTETLRTDAHAQSLDLVKLTSQRAANLDNLDATVTSRQSEAAAFARYSTVRSDLTNLDTHLYAQDANITVIHNETSKIGNPLYGSLAANDLHMFSDHMAILNQLAKLGIPTTGTLSGDIAALELHLDMVDSSIDAIKSDTTLIGLPDFGSLALDNRATLAAIHNSDSMESLTQGKVDALSTKVGTPTHGTIALDIASVQNDATILTQRLTQNRADALDFLDVSVASRQSESDASWRYTSLFNAIQAVLAGIGAIPNNTSFVGIVPPILVLPESSFSAKTYKFFVNLFDAQGMPEDPDAQLVTFRIEDVTGSTVIANTGMTRTSVGAYYCQYEVHWDDPERTLFVVFMYSKNGIPLQQTRIAEVQEYESKLDLLLQRLTQQRALNLDHLDTSISSRSSQVTLDAYYTDLASRSQAILDEANIIQTILGMPVVSIANDIGSIQSWVTRIGNPVTGTLAGDVAQVKTDTQRIGIPTHGTLVADLLDIVARIADLKFDVGQVKADTTTIDSNLTQGIADLLASEANIETLINNINVSQILSLLGVPAHATVSGDIAHVSGQVGATQLALGSMLPQTALLPNMDNTLATVATATATMNPKLDTIIDDLNNMVDLEPKVDQIIAGLSELELGCQTVNNNVAAIPVNPLRDNDTRLNYLDAEISSRATPADLSGGVGSGVLDMIGFIDRDEDELLGVMEGEPEGEFQGTLDSAIDELVGFIEDEG